MEFVVAVCVIARQSAVKVTWPETECARTEAWEAVQYGSNRSHLGRSILVAFLATIHTISGLTRYSLCAYQWLFIDGV